MDFDFSRQLGERREDFREQRRRHLATLEGMLDKARQEKRELTPGEIAEFDRIRDVVTELGKHTGGESRGVPTGRVREPEHRYTGEVEGREGELLRPDQSVSAWLEKRRNGRTAHDVDWNAYWAQRMGLQKPGLETRALGESTSSGSGAGAAIVPQEWSTSFVDIIRPQLVISRAGASVMPMESEIYNLPQYVSDVSPQWLAEGTTLTLDANPQFSTLQFNAQGAFTDVTLFSRQLAEDTNTSGGLGGLLTETIGKKYQRVIDQVAFYGVSGNAGNPGLVNESGLITQSMGTNGAAPTDTQFLSTAAEAVRNANAEPTAFITNPKVVGTVARLNASTYAKFWDLPSDCANLPWVYSTALASNETQGSGTNQSSLYVGDWSRLVVGIRVDLETTVLRERYADSNQIGILTYMRYSIRATHPESFVRVEGITAS